MDTSIVDDMKKEAKASLPLLIGGYALATLTWLLYPIWKIIFEDHMSVTGKESLTAIVVFLSIGTFGLYTWLCCMRYSLVITSDTIKVETLFRKLEVKAEDISMYSYGRYRKSKFYQFQLHIPSQKKIVTFSTRYHALVEEFLTGHEIHKNEKG